MHDIKILEWRFMKKNFLILLTFLTFNFATDYLHAWANSEMSEKLQEMRLQLQNDNYSGRELAVQPMDLPKELKTIEMMLIPDSEIFAFTYSVPNVEEKFCKKKYELLLINVIGKIKFSEYLQINERGVLQGRRGEVPLLRLYDVYDGEPFCIALLDENKDVFAAKEIIPKKIQTSSQSNAQIKVKLAAPGSIYYIVKGTGFLANEKLKCISQSCEEKIEGEFNVSEDGTFIINSLPQVEGRRKGKASLTIVRIGGIFMNERLYVEYSWVGI